MKILLILFGLLAVANAISSYYPGYGKTYGYGHGYGKGYGYGHGYGKGYGYGYGHGYGFTKTPYHFSKTCFYLPRACYKFKLSTCSDWYCPSYYSGILKYYPEDDCADKDWATLESECQTTLGDKRDEIKADLDADKLKWKGDLDKLVAEFKADHAKCQTDKYAPLIAKANEDEDTAEATRLEGERDGKIADYDTDLDSKVTEADGDYEQCITDTIAKLKEYHDDLILKFKDCYDDRLTKIGEYNEDVDDRVKEYEEKYKDALDEKLACQRESFKEILMKICEEEEGNIDTIITYYAPDPSIDDRVKEYKDKLVENADKLKEYYKCSYRCYAYSGCVTFNKRNYYSYCSRLGQWWCFNADCFSAPCVRYVKYTYKWQPCQYNCLLDCDPIEEHQTKEDYLVDLRAKNTKAVDDAKTDCETFISEWETKAAEYAGHYRDCIEDRHEAYIDSYTKCLKARREGGVLTEEDETKITEKTNELAGKVDGLVEDYEEKLKKKIEDAEKKAKDAIEDWETRLEDCVVDIADRYGECLGEIPTKISDYEGKLDDMIADRKTCLEDNLNAVCDKNYDCAEDIVKAWVPDDKMGEAPVTDFLAAVRSKHETERDEILGEFDTHWGETKKKLSDDYGCRLKCGQVNYSVCPWVRPRCFNLNICYPTSRCYGFWKTYYFKYYYHHTYHGHYYC